jgi:ABC-type transport system substrate-binding protein
MTVRRVLIFAPLAILFLLLQSYFWVPNYEEQTRGNPQRLHEFITGSIGDASMLNPILSADSASGEIGSMVFEGLLDRDENLQLRGRLAQSWEISENAFFYVNESVSVPGLGEASAQEIADFLQKTKGKKNDLPPELRGVLEHVAEISVVPPEELSTSRTEKGSEEGDERVIQISGRAPARIKLTLDQVDQDLFRKLELLLGGDYFSSFKGNRYLITEPELEAEALDRLAQEILPATEHNPVILFNLRPDVKFHDGHPFSAEDVKFTYDSIMNPKNISPRISDYEPVKSVEVLDPLTVQVTYKRLYSPALATWSMGILPKHLLNREALAKEALERRRDPEGFTMRQSLFSRNPVGCGPFRFQEWRSDQYIILQRFEDYWEGPPNYTRYAYRVIPDPLTQEMEFYAGTLDSYNVLPHQVKRLHEDPRFQSFSGLSFGYTYIGYNMRRKPFDDPRVRKALGMAIDADKIIEYVLYGQGERITGPFVKQTDYYNHGIAPLPYDPQGALQLLEDAGWERNREGWLEKDGKRFQFTLITNGGNDIRKAIVAIAQESWKQIGIDVRTDLLEWSVFIQERINKSDFDAVVLAWQMGVEPDLFQIWHSSQTNPFELNFVGFQNPEADDLIVKIRQEYNHEQQVEYSHRLAEIIAREQPYTFLYVGKWTAVLDKRIVIKETDPEGEVVYRKIEPTKTGSYTFHFNKWIKLPEVPDFAKDG